MISLSFNGWKYFLIIRIHLKVNEIICIHAPFKRQSIYYVVFLYNYFQSLSWMNWSFHTVIALTTSNYCVMPLGKLIEPSLLCYSKVFPLWLRQFLFSWSKPTEYLYKQYMQCIQFPQSSGCTYVHCTSSKQNGQYWVSTFK